MEANLKGENTAPQRSVVGLVLHHDLHKGMLVASPTIATYK